MFKTSHKQMYPLVQTNIHHYQPTVFRPKNNALAPGEDIRYDFSECHEGPPGAGPVREAFAYAEDCDLAAKNSTVLPQPLLDLPCQQPCEFNHYLRVKDSDWELGGERALVALVALVYLCLLVTVG